MNITIIRATKRKNSSTYNGAKYLVSKCKGAEKVFEFTLPDDCPHVCSGCYACLNGNENKCGAYEYLKPINEAFSKSDLIIFCVPVWCFHTPGQIKSFLDHYGFRWLVHRPNFEMQNKQAVIISTAGGGGLKSAVKDVKDSMDYWGIARTYTVTQSVWEYFWNDLPEKFQRQYMKKLDKTAKKLEKHSKKLKPSFKVKMLCFIFARLHLNGKMWETDNRYWKDNYKNRADKSRRIK